MNTKELFNKLYAKYSEVEESQKWVNSGINNNVSYFLEKDDENNLIILFQQTDSKFDWFCNLFFFPKKVAPYSNMEIEFKVHSGFWAQFSSVRDDLLQRIKSEVESESGIDNIYIYGWSLGGRLAMFCKEMVSFNFPTKPSYCITIGSPRGFVFTKNWEKLKSRFDNTTRFVNSSDLVTIVPFKFLGGLFSRFVHEVEKTQVGEKFNIFKIFGVGTYHLDTEYYKNINLDDSEK